MFDSKDWQVHKLPKITYKVAQVDDAKVGFEAAILCEYPGQIWYETIYGDLVPVHVLERGVNHVSDVLSGVRNLIIRFGQKKPTTAIVLEMEVIPVGDDLDYDTDMTKVADVDPGLSVAEMVKLEVARQSEDSKEADDDDYLFEEDDVLDSYLDPDFGPGHLDQAEQMELEDAIDDIRDERGFDQSEEAGKEGDQGRKPGKQRAQSAPSDESDSEDSGSLNEGSRDGKSQEKQ